MDERIEGFLADVLALEGEDMSLADGFDAEGDASFLL